MGDLNLGKFKEAIAELKSLECQRQEKIVEDQEERVKAECKKASQLLAKSWLPEGKRIKKQLIELSVKEGTSEEISDEIIEFFLMHDVDLRMIFPGPRAVFEMDWDSFFSHLSEGSRNVKIGIPYPPRPARENVTDRDLQNWIDNKNPEQYLPTTPYIPYSCF